MTTGKFKSEVLEKAWRFQDGFHRVDWAPVYDWIESNVDALDREDAWSEAAFLWVNRLREDLGGNYQVHSSKRTLVLCDKPPEIARWLLEYSGRIAGVITDRLGAVAWAGGAGKDVVLVFGEEDDYYQYISHYGRDGEQATTSGMSIGGGYTHIALPWYDQLQAADTIVHEFAHDCVAHLPLPVWLNEGLALAFERAVGQGGSPLMWGELAERHFSFWTEENIQSFWAGTSFREPGDPNELSYSLAEVLLKLLSEKCERATLQAFIESAHYRDAGQAAALDIAGCDLGEIAGTFLGDGNWRPQRKAIVACWKNAGVEDHESDSDPA